MRHVGVSVWSLSVVGVWTRCSRLEVWVCVLEQGEECMWGCDCARPSDARPPTQFCVQLKHPPPHHDEPL